MIGAVVILGLTGVASAQTTCANQAAFCAVDEAALPLFDAAQQTTHNQLISDTVVLFDTAIDLCECFDFGTDGQTLLQQLFQAVSDDVDALGKDVTKGEKKAFHDLKHLF
jgi:hypothetical protein